MSNTDFNGRGTPQKKFNWRFAGSTARMVSGTECLTYGTYPPFPPHMHPNTFLRTFWRLEVKPQVFVAMSFAPEYEERYKKVIAPAISSLRVNGTVLSPCRVDISKTGDSILTDIMEGVAHSQLVLADVSSVGKDSKVGQPYRNGNVMYEVGLALACRQPCEVLLVRDDRDKFLFDVSTVPHMHVEFTDIETACAALVVELQARLREQKYLSDARVSTAVASLSTYEMTLLIDFAKLPPDLANGCDPGGTVLSRYEAAIMGLLNKRLITVAGRSAAGFAVYKATELGRIVAALAQSGLQKYEAPPQS